jgi:transcriptional regulator with XRE-family HTH domain
MNRALTLKEVGRVRRALNPLLQRFPSQASLARALGVSQQTVSAVLSGAQFPGMRFALGVAQARGLSLEALLTTPSAGSEAVLSP